MEILIMNTYQHTLHEPKLLIEIESFTKRIICDGLKRKDLPELIRLLDAFEQFYSCNHVYADYVDIFHVIAKGELQRYKRMENGYCVYRSLLEIDGKILNEYSKLFREYQSKAKNDLRQYRFGLNARFARLKQHSERLFFHYSRNLVVRVDLKYRDLNQQLVDIEMFNQHVQKLRNRMANKDTCFKNLKFNAWCLEQAPLGSYHVHVYLIYDGSASTYDCKLARWVGRVWMDEITEGFGYYWNCHTCKYADEDLEESGAIDVNMESSQKEQTYKYLNGLGMIERKDPRGLDRLKAVYSYLCRRTSEKMDQRLRVRVKGMRAFGCSSC